MDIMGPFAGLVQFAVLILVIVSLWKVYVKAGRQGWEAIIPIYNLYVLVVIAGKPGWWTILFFIPIVGFIIGIMVYHELSKRFGKGPGFTVGLIFLPFIFFPILAFDSSVYAQPVATPPAPTPAA